ncbi:hypothetical protein [Streptomyces sp. NPDC015350]|uniref:hypothetical protein n=1 Tax=Streptomyces sp. NPDC015350 TaxID=3364955 RepID=UPI003702AB57
MHAPLDTLLAEIVRAARARWAIEECFQAAKNEACLGALPGPPYRAWYRRVSLVMAAAAHLTAPGVTTGEKGRQPPT